MSHRVTKAIKLNSGYNIPSVGLGCYDIPNARTAEVVYEACKVGYRHFDTAVLYHNEQEVGQGISKWLNEDTSNKREDVFYTTKLWNSECGYQNAKKAIDRCLDKVKELEYIDLLLIHSPLCGPEERLQTWKAMQEAVDAGKVKSIGVSNYGVKHLQQLLDWNELRFKPVVNQIEISPWVMRQELADWCRAHDIQVEAYAPLTHGYKVDHSVVGKIAARYSVSPVQVLIRWSLQHGNIPLPKTKTISRLKSNLDVYNFELTPDEVKDIDQPDAYEPTDWECTDAP